MSLLTSVIQSFPSFQTGNRLVDGGDLSQLANLLFQVQTGITAHAGGGQTAATQLGVGFNRVDTSGGGGTDSVVLPQAIPGMEVTLYNNTANTIQVFGVVSNPVTGVGDTITANNSNTPAATGTGISLATTKIAIFVCFAAGVWKEFLTA